MLPLAPVPAAATAGDAVERPPAALVDRLPCTREGLATGVSAFAALVTAGRHDATRTVWLPRRVVPTPVFFSVSTRGRGRAWADRGADVPAGVRRWTRDGRVVVRLRTVTAYPRPQAPARSSFAVVWTRHPPGAADGDRVLLGTGKGGWDCSRRRLSMFCCAERLVPVEVARRVATCPHGGTPLRRFGQAPVVCAPAVRR